MAGEVSTEPNTEREREEGRHAYASCSFRYGYHLRLVRQLVARACSFGSVVYYVYSDMKHKNGGETCKEEVYGEFWYRFCITALVFDNLLTSLYIVIRRTMGK